MLPGRMGAEDTIGQLGRFLILVLLLPGASLAAIAYWVLPDVAGSVVNAVPPGLGDGTTTLLILGLFTIFSLLFTAIPFVIEITVMRPRNWLPNLNFGAIADLEGKGFGVSQLTQQTGQGIMHYNIAVGTFLIGVAYAIRCLLKINTWEFPKIAMLVFIVLINFIVARQFYSWSKQTVEKLEKLDPPSKKTAAEE